MKLVKLSLIAPTLTFSSFANAQSLGFFMSDANSSFAFGTDNQFAHMNVSNHQNHSYGPSCDHGFRPHRPKPHHHHFHH